MRTDEDRIRQTREHRLSGYDILLECLRHLHPAVRLDRGCGFFLYLLSIGTAVAGLDKLLSRSADGVLLLLVSLTLWLCLLLGNLLVIVWEPAALEAQARSEPPKPAQARSAVSRARREPGGQGLRAVDAGGDVERQVSQGAEEP